MNIEEITFRMTESANELNNVGEYTEAIAILQSIDRLCDKNALDMPDEAIELNIFLDEKMGTDVLKLKRCGQYLRD